MPTIDSEVHPWVRIPRDWRGPGSAHAGRSRLSPASARYWWPPGRAGESAPAESPAETVDELLAAMDAHGIDVSVIMPGPFRCSNDAIAAAILRAPQRLIGFARFGMALPPFPDLEASARALAELERGLRDLGLRGVGEISVGEWWPLPPDAARDALRPVLELCRAYSVPMGVHLRHGGGPVDETQRPGLSYVQPFLLEPLLRDFPTVPVVLFHMGGTDRSLFESALALAQRYDNVYLGTSQSTPELVSQAVESLGPDRLIFGSDWYPLEPPEEAGVSRQHTRQRDIVEQATLDDRARDLILGGTLASLLGV